MIAFFNRLGPLGICFQLFVLDEKLNLPSESSLAAKALLDQSQTAARKAHTDLDLSSADLAKAQEEANQLASIVSRYAMRILTTACNLDATNYLEKNVLQHRSLIGAGMSGAV